MPASPVSSSWPSIQMPGTGPAKGRPLPLLWDDFDTTVGEWEKSTGTVNHQQVLAQLMHLADSPTQEAQRTLRRVPVFVTGNDLSKVYAPLRRPGRMRPFSWRPTESERREIVQRIMAPLLTARATTDMLTELPEAPISFFADLRGAVQAKSAQQTIVPEYAEDLKALVMDARPARRDLENHLRQHRPSDDEILQTALTLWHERTVATASHLNE